MSETGDRGGWLGTANLPRGNDDTPPELVASMLYLLCSRCPYPWFQRQVTGEGGQRLFLSKGGGGWCLLTRICSIIAVFDLQQAPTPMMPEAGDGGGGPGTANLPGGMMAPHQKLGLGQFSCFFPSGVLLFLLPSLPPPPPFCHLSCGIVPALARSKFYSHVTVIRIVLCIAMIETVPCISKVRIDPALLTEVTYFPCSTKGPNPFPASHASLIGKSGTL